MKNPKLHIHLSWCMIFVLWGLGQSMSFGQSELGNRFDKRLVADTSFQQVHPQTVMVNGMMAITSGDTLQYLEDFVLRNNTIKFAEAHQGKTVELTFRVLPFNMAGPYSLIDTATLAMNRDTSRSFFQFNPFKTVDNPIDWKGLNYRGSFSRGISVGNAQNLVFNSAFNLQMSGQLGDGLELSAAITDANIPLQPEGNTRQLNEFDRVFIQLKKEQHQLIAGDFDLKKPEGYFINYFKRLQGAAASTGGEFRGGQWTTQVSGALARGKFSRNTIVPQEKNQGPYRLTGAEGETFIIILAGTEKVFFDGQILSRGADADYVVDYNRGDITFTPTRLVTKDSRIIIEFEYADQNYQRTLYAVNSTYQKGKAKLHINLYGDQDAKRPVDDTFNEEELRSLSRAGDNPRAAIVASIDTVEMFSAFRVLYRWRDTLVCGQMVRYLDYDTEPDSAILAANFSEVGFGNGDYILDTRAFANGRVYRYVAPVDCIPQGNFAPIAPLVAPKSQQVLAIGGSYTLDKKSKVWGELSGSRRDLNRLSEVDDNNNEGYALAGGWEKYWLLDEAGLWELQHTASAEILDERYTILNPYRPAEFNRDWGLTAGTAGQLDPSIPPIADEFLAATALRISRKGVGNLQYGINRYNRAEILDGWQHQSQASLSKNGWTLNGRASYLLSENSTTEVRFLRPQVELRKSIESLRGLAIVTNYRGEKNKRRTIVDDVLALNSAGFDEFGASIEWPGSDSLSFVTGYTRRIDYMPSQLALVGANLANDYRVEGKWSLRKKVKVKFHESNLQWNLHYRTLEVLDTMLSAQTTGNTYLGRLQHQWNMWGGAIRNQMTYELGSGQERKFNYTYLRVPDGEGSFFWQDRNEDGAVQQDEIEIAVFQNQGNAIRVINYSNEFVPSNLVNWSQNLSIDPRAIWYGSKSKMKKRFSRLSLVTSTQIQRRVLPIKGTQPLNPFLQDVADTALVATSLVARQTLFLNRGGTGWEWQFGRGDIRSKQLQVGGFEARTLDDWFTRWRINPYTTWSFEGKYTIGQKGNTSQQFASRNYLVEFWEVEPIFLITPTAQMRFGIGYSFQNASNTLRDMDNETLLAHSGNINWALNQSAKSSVRGKFEIIWNTFSGTINSPVGYLLLEGLQDGRNFVWELQYDRQLGKNLRLGLSYEGRKPGATPIVHTGRAQVTALF